MSYSAVLALPIGQIGIRCRQQKLVKIDFLQQNVALIEPTDAFTQQVVRQIKRYFDSANHSFNLAIELEGTPFQQRVWQALLQIPRGEVRSYGQLAQQLKSGARAVGNACRRNPVPLVIPCHRVVASGGLGGFSGQRDGGMIHIKTWLLRHEGITNGVETGIQSRA